jgi:hypothetical protein
VKRDRVDWFTFSAGREGSKNQAGRDSVASAPKASNGSGSPRTGGHEPRVVRLRVDDLALF